MKIASYALVALLLLLNVSCYQEETAITQSITIPQVQAFYNQLSQDNKGGRTEGLTILWEEGTYKGVSTGDALVFPVTSASSRYVQLEETEVLMRVESVAHAFAYLDNDQELHLDYVQQIPIRSSTNFTGHIIAGSWGQEPTMVFTYKNGELVNDARDGRLEDCTTVSYYECTTVSVGDEIYGSSCDLVRQTTVCNNPTAAPELAPEDFGGRGGGGGLGNRTSLCPHPGIVGLMVPCEEDVCEGEGYVKDQNGDCIRERKLENKFKLCANTLQFVPNGNGFTADILGLGAYAVHEESKKGWNVEFGATCVTMKVNSAIFASEEFALVYNLSRDELDQWLQTQDDETMTSSMIRTKLIALLKDYLELINNSVFQTQKCEGLIPVSVAGYHEDC